MIYQKEYLHEDEAAKRMAKEIAGDNLYSVGSSEGKMTINSQAQGLLIINEYAVHEIINMKEWPVLL